MILSKRDLEINFHVRRISLVKMVLVINKSEDREYDPEKYSIYKRVGSMLGPDKSLEPGMVFN